MALHRQGRLAEALDLYRVALEEVPQAAPAGASAHHGAGLALAAMGRHPEALEHLQAACRLRPAWAAAHFNRGLVLRALGRREEALAAYREAASLDPGLVEAPFNAGNLLRELGRREEALAAYAEALARRPTYAAARANRADVLLALGRPREALEEAEAALALDPRCKEAWVNRGLALDRLGREREALASYERAAALAPAFAAPWVNAGDVLLRQGRAEQAALCFEEAWRRDPTHPLLAGSRLHARLAVARWEGWREETAALVRELEAGRPASAPFCLVALPVPRALQRQAAERFTAAQWPARSGAPAVLRRGGRIRVGYFSSDFREHATAVLVARLFEVHDRERFEVYGYSYGPDDGGPARRRILEAFDRAFDVRGLSDAEVAALARRHGLDVAVDLKGLTEGARLGIFAHRAAPVQVTWLGYPGTTGAPFLDYLLADPVVVPEEHLADYTEQVVHLPCYQVNDDRRPLPEAPPRAALGLPGGGFVFACFNATYKINPEVFDVWMRLLAQVEGSVLWLLDPGEEAAGRLRREAEARGVAPSRLVFAPRRPYGEYLARFRAADLFLDTWPCNAHTTASDALWAGLPLVTCRGETFAGRVAASLLRAVGLEELVALEPAGYERLALELARDRERLVSLRRHLEAARTTAPLFDTRRFARSLEAAYERMVERARRGLPPEPFAVEGPHP